MPVAREIYQEGLILPPVRLVRRGRIVRDVWRIVLANVRTPDEREGDLTAQIAANRVADARLPETVARYGRRAYAGLRRARCRTTPSASCAPPFAKIPDGRYEFEDALDDDGFGETPVRFARRSTIAGRSRDDRLHRIGSAGRRQRQRQLRDDAVGVSLRVPLSRRRGRCLYNAGVSRPLTVIAPEGTIVNARRPAAVAGGNVETSQRITDVVLGALGRALPDRMPAASQGTMNNVTLGGTDPRTGRPFAYYETIGGGMGGRRGLPGLSAACTRT